MTPLRFAGASLGLLMLAACTMNQSHEKLVTVRPETLAAYLQDKPQSAQPFYARVLMEGERNAVLNHMRAGLVALEADQLDAAAASFDQALQRIEAIYADTESAEKARSLWTKENFKDFKGEPYERAMAYYYRGLIYLMEGDYENARASFKGGMLQDAMAEAEIYQSDFASLAFLEGWASHCAGSASLARDSFAEAHALQPSLPKPDEQHDLLLLAESGRGPIKVAGGERRQRLQFTQGAAAHGPASFLLQPRGASAFSVPAATAEDLYWQASTRGGRQVDAILDGKAQFKDATDSAGDVAVAAGIGVMSTHSHHRNDNAAVAGAIVVLAGLIAKAAADAMRPEADLRTWDNLPGSVHVATLRRPEEGFSVSAAFGGTARPAIVHQAGRCAIAWSRSEPAAAIPETAPGAVAAEANMSYLALMPRIGATGPAGQAARDQPLAEAEQSGKAAFTPVKQ